LYHQLRKEGVYQFSAMSLGFTFKCLFSSLLMAAAVWYVGQQFTWKTWHFTEQVLLLSGLLVLAVFVYFAALFILGVRLNTIKSVATTESN
jgi:putative peptidoglycan lipid II flippase